MFIARLLFPNGEVSYETEKSFEVNGLTRGTIPNNCKILDQAKDTYTPGLGRREFYLVDTGDYYVYLRVCDAMEGSGYDEFAVGHNIFLKTDKNVKELLEQCTNHINNTKSNN